MSAPVIIIGGGHNGLVAATSLAKAGQKVLLLEARSELGGLAGGDEFHPGHRALGVLNDTRSFRPWVARELGLERYGLSYCDTPETITGHAEGHAPIYLKGDALSGAVSDQDQQQMAEFRALINRLRGPLMKLLDRPPLNPKGALLPLVGPMLSIRALGAGDMTALMRIPPMCAADWMRDSFANERLGSLVAHGGLIGNMAGPWSPWTAANVLFDLVTEGTTVRGGAETVCQALAQAARVQGAELRPDATVERIAVERGRVKGVHLADGEFIECAQILATSDPKSLFSDLISPRYLTPGTAERAQNIRARGVTAVLDLALREVPRDVGGQPVTLLRTGASLDDLERAFDPVKYREIPTDPIINLRVTPTSDGAHATGCALIHFVPEAPRNGWTSESRETLRDAVFTQLKKAAPGVGDLILAHRLRTPQDLAAEYRLHGGHIFHGEHAPDQLLFMRPMTECAEFSTPISGLFIGGSGAHPGGGLTGVPGILAARALLRAG